VNGMHDRQAQACRRHPPQDSGLRAMGMHDVWMNFPQQPDESSKTANVGHRPYASNQLREDDQRES
jgi:hypothetical protein